MNNPSSYIKVIVGSKNPLKIESVKEAFGKYFPQNEVIGFAVASKVRAQPIGNETYIGAENRTKELIKLNKESSLFADYFVGIEGGVEESFNRWFAFGCMCIANKKGQISFATSARFELPKEVVNKLLLGQELGHVMDDIQDKNNTKQKEGAIGYLTNGVMNRKELYIPGIVSAIIPFLHEDMYFGINE